MRRESEILEDILIFKRQKSDSVKLQQYDKALKFRKSQYECINELIELLNVNIEKVTIKQDGGLVNFNGIESFFKKFYNITDFPTIELIRDIKIKEILEWKEK